MIIILLLNISCAPQYKILKIYKPELGISRDGSFFALSLYKLLLQEKDFSFEKLYKCHFKKINKAKGKVPIFMATYDMVLSALYKSRSHLNMDSFVDSFTKSMSIFMKAGQDLIIDIESKNKETITRKIDYGGINYHEHVINYLLINFIEFIYDKKAITDGQIIEFNKKISFLSTGYYYIEDNIAGIRYLSFNDIKNRNIELISDIDNAYNRHENNGGDIWCLNYDSVVDFEYFFIKNIREFREIHKETGIESDAFIKYVRYLLALETDRLREKTHQNLIFLLYKCANSLEYTRARRKYEYIFRQREGCIKQRLNFIIRCFINWDEDNIAWFIKASLTIIDLLDLLFQQTLKILVISHKYKEKNNIHIYKIK